MKVKFRFPKPLIWGSVALLLFAVGSCSSPTDPDSVPSSWDETSEQDSSEQGSPEQGSPEQSSPEQSSGEEPEDEIGGNEEQESAEGGDAAAKSGSSGGIRVRIGEIETGEIEKPEDISRYALDFFTEDGRTAESLSLNPKEEITVTLDAGEWEIRAYGVMERGSGQPPLAVISGTAHATVPENGTKSVLIVPGRPAAGSGYVEIDGIVFPPAPKFSSTGELKAFLDAHPENTADTPYPLKIAGVDLSSKEGTGETLKTLYNALSRYVTLDLRECTGTELISASAYAGRKKIVSMILPDSITGVAANGFAGYEALESVVLPKVIKIDYAAFHELEKLETVSAPELTGLVDSTGTTASNKGIFYNCAALKSVYFPKLETIGHHAFYGCDALTEVLLPKAVEIGPSVFAECTALKTVVLPEAGSIGNRAFYNDKALENLILGPIPPVLDGSAHFASGYPLKIYVPSSAIEDYQNSASWTKMKDKIHPLAD
jgi:hypothetical protein